MAFLSWGRRKPSRKRTYVRCRSAAGPRTLRVCPAPGRSYKRRRKRRRAAVRLVAVARPRARKRRRRATVRLVAVARPRARKRRRKATVRLVAVARPRARKRRRRAAGAWSSPQWMTARLAPRSTRSRAARGAWTRRKAKTTDLYAFSGRAPTRQMSLNLGPHKRTKRAEPDVVDKIIKLVGV
jgi:hypothetical protein